MNGNSGLTDHLIPPPHLGVEGVPIAAGEGEDSARTEADTEADTDCNPLSLTSMVDKMLERAKRDNKETKRQLGLKKRRL